MRRRKSARNGKKRILSKCKTSSAKSVAMR
jgi:hypothetical protein